MLLPEYQSSDIENCLISFLMCAVRFRDLPGLDRPFVSVEMGDFLQKATFENPSKASKKSKQDFPLLFSLTVMTFVLVHELCSLGRMAPLE